MRAQASSSRTRQERLALAGRVGAEAAGPAAVEVDREARFPHEALEALRKAKLLSVHVPVELGGEGVSLSEMGAMCTALGQHCAATAMIFAMHQIQVGCLVRHGLESPRLRQYLADLVERQLLLASATSEVGVGGELRRSIAAVDRQAELFTLVKEASTISYGEQADGILVTARRDAEAPAGDQVLVLVRKEEYTLERKGSWDTMGMRGTCSPGFHLTSRGAAEQILQTPFADIAGSTMVPFSHVLWASCWLGIASDAVSRARTIVQTEARKKPGTVPPTALRLSEVNTKLATFRSHVHAEAHAYEAAIASADGGREILSSVGTALRLNMLKIAASEHLLAIVTQALMICGIAGYRNDTPASLGRHLRDAFSAMLMIGNDRIHATNAMLLLVSKG